MKEADFEWDRDFLGVLDAFKMRTSSWMYSSLIANTTKITLQTGCPLECI